MQYSQMLNKIVLGDCLEIMKHVPDGSVDMVLCDLPYGMTSQKWDSVIPFEPLWEQYNRIVKLNGAMVFTAAQPFTSALVMSNPKHFKYDWVWQKPKGTGHLNVKKQPMRDKEDILVFYRKQSTYNPQMGRGEPYETRNSKKKITHFEKGATIYGSFNRGIGTDNPNLGTRYPKQVLEFGIVERGGVHPTQKPVELFEYLIKTYTNEGEVVLDNCIGSGTTAEAALRTNRQFIGIEQDEQYWKIACERIDKFRELNE